MRHEMVWCDYGWMPYHYGFCPSEKTWAVEMKRLGLPHVAYPLEKAGCTTLLTNKKDKKPVAIVTVAVRTPQQTVELLVHEAMHVWRDIRKSIGEKKPSSEFEAYAMQNIVGQLIDAYQKTRGPLFTRQRP